MSTKRRERVEPGIYRRPDGRFEIGWRDASGKQRWRAVTGGIKAARAELAAEHARRASGGLVAPPRLTFQAAFGGVVGAAEGAPGAVVPGRV